MSYLRPTGRHVVYKTMNHRVARVERDVMLWSVVPEALNNMWSIMFSFGSVLIDFGTGYIHKPHIVQGFSTRQFQL